jgi:hypothetical protein
MSGIQCGGCGRFLAGAHASREGDYCWWWHWESWDFDEVDIYVGAS